MFSKFKHKIKNKNEILALTFLIIITIISTSYFNYSQKIIQDNYNELELTLLSNSENHKMILPILIEY